MRKLTAYLFLLLLVLPIVGDAGAAGRTVHLSAGERKIFLGDGALSVLVDPGGELGIDAVADTAQGGDFVPLPGNLGAGYGTHAHWLKFTLERPADQPSSWLLEVLPSYLDDLRLYEPDGRGGMRERITGDLLPFTAREVEYRGFVFKLDVPAGSSTYYLRVRTTSTQAAVLNLWQSPYYAVAVQREYLFFGLQSGLLLATALLSLLTWVFIREPLHLYFSGLILLQQCLTATINGFTAQYIFPEGGEFVGMLVGVLTGLNVAFAFIFFDLLLQLPHSHPRTSRFFRLCSLFGLVTAFSVPLGLYSYTAAVLISLSLLTNCALLWLGPWMLRGNGVRGWVNLAAFSLYALVGGINLSGLLGLGPFHLWVLNGAQLPAVIYFLLFNFSIHLRVAEANRQRKQALDEAERERTIRDDQGRFLSMITHELRTPISVISAALQSLRLFDPAPEARRLRRYQRIDGSVRRMDAMLQACEAEDRMVTGCWITDVATVDLRQLTLNLIEEFGDETRRRVRFACPDELPAVQGEAAMLRVVLRNLLDNAIKYAPGSETIEIVIRAQSESGKAGVSWRISDRGPGLPPEVGERVFEKYYRGGEGSGAPGLGLGLYLSRRIVSKHEGTIAADTACAQGASFVCWLPLKLSESF